jgi:uncharacterized membrane protein YqjE
MEQSEFRSDSVAVIVREITSSMKDIARGEARLAKAELKDAGQRVGRDAITLGIFGVLAVLGVLPFLAFLVVGLGRILGDNYWVSSLIVSIFCFAVGGAVAYGAFKKIKQEASLSLPRTRHMLNYEVEAVKDEFKDFSEVTQRRAA